MSDNFSLSDFLRELKSSDFVLGCEMPMGYTPGLPTLLIKNDALIIQIPYLKYQTTGETDKTLVFPVRYVIELTLPDLKFINYKDLMFDSAYQTIDFSRPIGLFRHDTIKNLNKREYKAKKEELFKCYDEVVDYLLNDGEYTDSDENHFKELFSLMLEPSLYKMYRVLNKDFCNKYLLTR